MKEKLTKDNILEYEVFWASDGGKSYTCISCSAIYKRILFIIKNPVWNESFQSTEERW